MNPVTGALKQVLGTTMESVEVFDYSIAEDFEKLWKFQVSKERIIIVWGGTTPDAKLWPIDASACLSPLDWAVAYARHSLPEKVGKEEAEQTDAPVEARQWPQIMILDADPAAHASVPTLAHFHTLREDQLPWLTVPKIPSLKDVCKWLAPTTKQVDQTTLAALDRFLREIRLNLTEVRKDGDYDRHAISNIVAPMVLLGKAANPSLHANALLKLLQASGLCGDNTLEDGTIQTDVGKELSILLVDDQAEHGWKDWLKNSLKPAKFEYRTNPYDLLDTLEDQLAEADKVAEEKNKGTKANDLRFRLQLPGLENAVNPVLFLDLRLFSGNADAERAFYQRLLKLIENRFLGNDLAWPGFDLNADAFQKAKIALAQAPQAPSDDPTLSFVLESSTHHETLTWLPRVMALADMSLPIVVFSSTDRATIRKAFAAYGNIFTSFQKPSLGSLNHMVSPEDNLKSLADLTHELKSLLEIRSKCLLLHELAEGLPPSANETTGSLHVELYIDEDKKPSSPNFAVGGVFAVFQSKDYADAFEDVCVSKGLRYFEDTVFSPNVPSDQVLDKHRDNGVTQLRIAIDHYRQNQRSVDLGFVRLRRGDIAGNDHPLASQEQDLCFWRMLEALLELFCSESLPAIKKQFDAKRISFSVFVGTRVVETIENGDFSYQASIPIRRFRSGDKRLRSLGERDAFPIVLKSLSLHRILGLFELDRAAALALPYKPSSVEGAPQSKEMLDRLLDRSSQTVYTFSPDHDTVLDECVDQSFGRVITCQPDRGFFHVSVIGIQDNVFCHVRECVDIDLAKLQRGMSVKFNVQQDHEGRYRGLSVSIVTQEEVEEWEASQNRKVSDEFLVERTLDREALLNFRPDYRALHYSADQMVRDVSVFTDVLSSQLAGQFDEVFTSAVEQSLVASRLLDDNRHIASALRSFTIDSIQAFSSGVPLARSWIASRIWEQLLQCKGEVIILPQTLPVRPNSKGVNKNTTHPQRDRQQPTQNIGMVSSVGASGNTSNNRAATSPQIPKGATRKKVLLKDTICINGLPRGSEDDTIKAALVGVGIEGVITRIQSSKAGCIALVNVGEDILQSLLNTHSSGICLLGCECKVAQAFDLVHDTDARGEIISGNYTQI